MEHTETSSDHPSGFDLIIVPDDDGSALVLVDASVGEQSVRCLLDTGAATTCLRTEEIPSAPVAGDATPSAGLFGASSSEVRVIVPSISLGPITATEFPVRRVEARGDLPEHLQNLIGMDLLNDHRLWFRFDQRRVEVDLMMKLDATIVQPLFLDQTHHPYVDVHLGSTVAHAVWDSGAGMTIVDHDLVAAHPDQFQPAGTTQGTDATGATMETPLYHLTGASIGGQRFPPHPVAAVDLGPVNATITHPMEMVLGYTTLRFANWWFDFPNRHWAITKMLPSVVSS